MEPPRRPLGSFHDVCEMFCRITKIRPILSVCHEEAESWRAEPFAHGLSPAGQKQRLGPKFPAPRSESPGRGRLVLVPRFHGPLWPLGGEGQVHKALLVWPHMPTSSCSYYRVVILCQETQNNCFYSSQWTLMHMTFREHISGCCRALMFMQISSS